MKHQHARRCPLVFKWPDPPLRVVLVEPQIPPNTGNIARTCAATGCILHLVEPLGFKISDAKLKRAGLDYWDSVALKPHKNFEDFLEAAGHPRLWLFTVGARRSYFEAEFRPGDALVFGSETKGLSDELLARYPDRTSAYPCGRTMFALSTSRPLSVSRSMRLCDNFRVERRRPYEV